MSTSQPPHALLESWERLSAAESEAIQSGNWGHLATLQTAIRHLLDRLESALEGGTRLDPHSLAIVHEISARERANLALVDARQREVASERSSLDRARWNLRRQHHSFVTPNSGNWQRYS